MDDVLALEALLELSQTLNPEYECQLSDQKFPLLDKATVESAMGSVVYIFENKRKWKTPCTNLVKKWCDVRDIGLQCRHLSWMGNASSLANSDCLLAVCQTLVDVNSPKNLLSLELQQQQAVCLAIICLADKNDKARKLSIKLFEFIIDHAESVDAHSDFLIEMWNLRGILGLSFKQIELVVLKCPLGLETELLKIATTSIKNDALRTDFYGKEEDDTSLLNLCLLSPAIFQVTVGIMMLLIQKSQAHKNVMSMFKAFIQKCLKDEQNIVKLFPAKCQVPLALLSIPPEETDLDTYIVYLLDALSDLPLLTSILLIILYDQWVPYLADKL